MEQLRTCCSGIESASWIRRTVPTRSDAIINQVITVGKYCSSTYPMRPRIITTARNEFNVTFINLINSVGGQLEVNVGSAGG